MTSVLEIRGLRAGYGAGEVLQGVDLDVSEGQVVALFGRNGAGKTTLLSSVMGFVRPLAGSVRVRDHVVTAAPPHVVARAGVAIVPQGRRVFAGLTVDEHLRIAARGDGPWNVERVYELLPALARRRRNRGDQLSGGEQQMLAIGRALSGNPTVLLLDEPSEGLAPAVVETIVGLLASLKAAGVPALLVEQQVATALQVADEVLVMRKGQIVHRADAIAFRDDPETVRTLLGV